ncbi:TlpA family protein disulfide reductase [Chitinophaga arvensicola]|uniref:Peroxiredoxin n=1 Tax=Chitinophaga arvensicola TaxID=29529 RepID=A0A1I0RH18_9BACT|nr:TlpA disulfide reductase family protein [Chitinophaga arvensicola]SEW40165.1 Peroxiredoxin [Chitinophaga arvensicola]
MRKLAHYIKLLICLLLILSGEKANAQAALVQKAIDKVGSYQHLKYQLVSKIREYTDDTMVSIHKDLLLKAPGDTNFGYFFRMEALNPGNSLPYIAVYNGKNLAELHPQDSTYTIDKIKPYPFAGSLPGYLKVISNLLKKKPSEMAADTTIDAHPCSHVVLNTYDTVINKEHLYTRIHIFIDQLSGLPVRIMANSRSANTGDGITDYYLEFRYTNYELTESPQDLVAVSVPEGFHLPLVQTPVPVLLAAGTVAPDWELYSSDGRKLSLSQLKGKVVLLDFFFIGCMPCMQSLKPLNRLHEKYKNVEFVSLTSRDSKSSVTKFRGKYNISYPIYTDAADVEAQYHVTGFPTFYFIDKKGTIASVLVGYGDDFEQKVAATLDSLL